MLTILAQPLRPVKLEGAPTTQGCCNGSNYRPYSFDSVHVGSRGVGDVGRGRAGQACTKDRKRTDRSTRRTAEGGIGQLRA